MPTAVSRPERPTVSVVIPTWNRRDLVARAVESVLAQTRPPEEVIVVDDGSTDGTAASLAERFPDLNLVEQENRGVSAARNRGVHEAAGSWIAFLDSDDRWLETKLERQLAAIEASPDYLLCHTDEIWIRRGRRVNPMKKHRKYGGHIFERALPLCVVSPSSVLLQRRLFDEVGLFDEALPACEDYDLWLRVTARFPVLYLEEKLVEKYGGHEDQLSRRFIAMDRFRITALRKLLSRNDLAEGHRRAAEEELSRKIAIYASGARKRGNESEASGYEAELRRLSR
jgi:glycosyltransferase involved in cell wall biosynthesis